jgi:uncharacterized protein (DUF58 family)
MHFSSHLANHSKAERAVVLALALASLLSDGGERIGIPGLMDPKARRNATAVMMDTLSRSISRLSGLPNPEVRLSSHSEIVIFSDFLEAEQKLAHTFRSLARQNVRGHAVQILDPAEESLPYEGRVEFLDQEDGTRFVAERAETLRASYRKRLDAHKAAIAMHAAELGWTPFLHHTDRPAVEALLSLHMHLSGLEKAYRSKGMIRGALGERSGSS